jgi:GTP-binding protein Era
VIWLVEMGSWTAADEHILRELAPVEQPVILAVNKMDRIDPAEYDAFLREVAAKRDFAAVIPISAQEGTNLDQLEEAIIERLEDGPQYYPEDWVTDQPERILVAEFIREELLVRTEEEIPHSIAVDVDQIEEDEERNLIRIRATIYVERDSQKGIVIGKGGRMLKEVGISAREQIERLLNTQVYLDLWVKVKKDWRNKPGALREFGYE